ncbi:hypothetical protein GGG16DRAFT_120021 [Schizophyllum commune]
MSSSSTANAPGSPSWAYELITKSMEERTVVESALAAANAHIDDLKDEVAATKKRLDDSYDKADALVATIKDKNALIDERELEILNLHMHLNAVAQTWDHRLR